MDEITRLCGYLPLAIGLIASQLRHHPAQTAESVAASLAAATDRLELMRAENLSVAAAFDLSYQDLSPGQQRLFRRLGLIPGPTFDAYAAAALDGASPGQARRQLDELYDQHLITEPALGRYQLHDLLREHARALAATDDQADRDAAAGRVLDYYLHTALAAGRHFAPWASTYRRPLPGNRSAQAPDLSTLGQSAAWLEAERANLHAAADYAATRGHSRHAVAIPAAMAASWRPAVTGISPPPSTKALWRQRARLETGSARPTRSARWAHCSGRPGSYPAAAASLARALALYRDVGDRPGQADALNELGFLRVLTGDYPAATASHQQALATGPRHSVTGAARPHAVNDLGLVQQSDRGLPGRRRQPAAGPGAVR